MQIIKFLSVCIICIYFSSCSRTSYTTNGKTIYFTGKNISGDKLLDKDASAIKIVNSCRTCHGKDGDMMSGISIKYSYLSDAKNFTVPYTDSLLFRFLDNDLRSDGTKADIGVIWRMSDKDKADLVNYLKTL